MNSSSPAIRKTGEAFALGVMIMLAVNVLQRSVGLLRGIGFARYLSDVELGQWALANSFLIIAVPIAALGFSGSFGKFVEYYRNRNQFSSYFDLCLKVTIWGAFLTTSAILFFPDQFGFVVFGERLPSSIVGWCVLCLLGAIAFSFVSELAAGFRQISTVSYMQFTQSLVFAVLGVGLAFVYRSWWVLLPAFAVANLCAIVPGWIRIRAAHGSDFLSVSPGDGKKYRELLQRLVPFAASLWAMNLMANLFDLSDRYMVLHLMEGGQQVGQSMVGQYHCARILPNLLISLGTMLGGVVLPYLSADWERQRIDLVTARIRQLMQGVAISFLGISTAALSVAPFLFRYFIDNNYEIAESVLPLVLAQAIWIALFLIAEPFMLCAEKGRQLLFVLFLALAGNFALNWCLIPMYGLTGAIVATSVANVFALFMLIWKLRQNGCELRPGTIALCLVPCALLGGAISAAIAFVGIVFLCGRTNWLLSQEDRDAIDEVAVSRLNKFGLRLQSIWP